MPGSGMFTNVTQSLLHDAEHRQFDRFGQTAQGWIDLQLKLNIVAFRPFVCQRGDGA